MLYWHVSSVLLTNQLQQLETNTMFVLFSFFLMYSLSEPPFSLVGRIPGTTAYRSFDLKNKKVVGVPGILIIRLDCDLIFTNVGYFRDQLEIRIKKSKYEVHGVVVDCSAMSSIDTAGVAGLIELKEWLDSKSITIHFAYVKHALMPALRGGKFFEATKISPQFHLQVHEAVMEAKRCAVAKIHKMQECMSTMELNDEDESNAATADFEVEVEEEQGETKSDSSQMRTALSESLLAK